MGEVVNHKFLASNDHQYEMTSVRAESSSKSQESSDFSKKYSNDDKDHALPFDVTEIIGEIKVKVM